MSYENALFELVNRLITDRYPQFKGKIFFANELAKQPKKPFLLMQEVTDENNHRTVEINGIVTEFKSVTIAFTIVVNGVDRCGDNDPEQKYFAKEVRDYLRIALNRHKNIDFLLEHNISPRIERMSGCRDDTEPTSGGYIYSYAFDCPFDYINTLEFERSTARGVNVEINNDSLTSIDFEV